MKNRRSMLPPAAAVIAACVLAGCVDMDSTPTITGAEYRSESTFAVYHFMDFGYTNSLSVQGQDEFYSVGTLQSQTQTSFWGQEYESVYEVSSDFISGDRITVTATGVVGSAEFDVPYKE